MARYVSYFAKRELIAGRTAGDLVTIDLDGLIASLDRDPKDKTIRKRSLSRKSYLTFEAAWNNWLITTIPLTNDDSNAKLFREFIASARDQQIVFQPGTEYIADTSPPTDLTVELIRVGREKRTRIGPAVDRFAYSFTLEEVSG